jgi:hypothetical protein
LSFGIGTLGFIALRVSSSMRDTAQSRNGLSSAGTMYQGAVGVSLTDIDPGDHLFLWRFKKELPEPGR